MKCKNCQYCSQRGGYQYFFCDRDNSLIEPNDYYGEKNMDCNFINFIVIIKQLNLKTTIYYI
mgnify:CR=1 FL=1